MIKNLVIVESPAKAKTIEKFLGKDYHVESSFGHIADLPDRKLGVDVEKNYEPEYIISKDKKDLVKKLKTQAGESEMVWLASDEDREGEAIAWHLYEFLELSPEKTRRIVFNEITPTAIQNAIKVPRNIDINLVNAQQARRVLDRLVGYEISPLLWKKIKSGLSAGRVQSVAVRLIVEREREIQAFQAESAYKVVAEFLNGEKVLFKAELDNKFEHKEQAEAFLKNCIGAEFTVSDIETKPAKRSPAAPFTTSTLQQEASRKLGYSVSQTMTLAQRLYEGGHITYMRTDSVHLSNDAIAAIKDEVTSRYGAQYSHTRQFETKSKGAQEAHEAIRPAYMNRMTAGDDDRQRKLYELIWKRAVASQMAEARLERTTVKIEISKETNQFIARGEVLLFDGFLKVYGFESESEDSETAEGMLPKLSQGEKVTYNNIKAVERFTKAPARYGEASLVKKLEELGIGRPSTYAPTISTIQRREYVEKGDREGQPRQYGQLILEGGSIRASTQSEMVGSDKGKLIPTDIGTIVNDFLLDHFADIMDYKFTAQAEEELDRIAEGEMDWVSLIDKFYKDFHPSIENVGQNAERATGERILGEHPENKKRVSVRIGRFGPMVQVGVTEDEEKPVFASLKKGQSINDITLEEALELFKLPRVVGQYNGEKVTAAIGRFGPYIKFGSKFVSLKPKEGDDPLTVEIERAIELIQAKEAEENSRVILRFDGQEPVVEVLNGRYGPYISIEKNNVKIPRDIDPATLTREKCMELAESAPSPAKKASFRGRKSK